MTETYTISVTAPPCSHCGHPYDLHYWFGGEECVGEKWVDGNCVWCICPLFEVNA